jgi:hypothetical protein
MKRISLWAAHNKGKARLCFVAIYLLLHVVCFFFSEALLAAGIEVPVYFSYLLCMPLFTAFILYPSRKEKSRYRHFYRFQKTMDGVLFLSSFLLIICTFNQLTTNHLWPHASSSFAAEPSIKPVNVFRKIKVQTAQATFIVKHVKELKANVRLLRKAYKESSKGGKTALIILATVVAAFLWVLVLGLSCNLSCSGAEGGALAVLILGTGLITLLLIKVIMAINRSPKKKEKPAEINPVDS